LRRAIAVRIARNVSENGAPERIRTADPQIRSLASGFRPPLRDKPMLSDCR
jgi:hypothetical protein